MRAILQFIANNKKASAAIAGVLVGFAARYGLNIDQASVETLLYPVLAYIVGQGSADFGKEAAKVNQRGS